MRYSSHINKLIDATSISPSINTNTNIHSTSMASPSKRSNMDDGNEIPRKRRILVERRAKASISSDPSQELTEAISQHLGIARNRSFNELSTKEKQEVGISLKIMLSDVSDGALMPLMHYTLDAEHIRKLVNIKQIQSSIAKDNICQTATS